MTSASTLRRVIVAAFAALVALALAAPAGSAWAAETSDWEISKSKTATNLDENFESKVTLSLPSAEEKQVFDVVFVLDKSKSTAKSEISEAVENLLNKIKGSQGEVNIGVVTFNAEVANTLPLTPLTEDNLEKIQDAIELVSSSGTNIHAGLQTGIKLLNEGKAEEDHKYLILVSDGITYLYNDENGNGPKAINYSGQTTSSHYAYEYGSNAAPADWGAFLKDAADRVAKDGTTYEGDWSIDGNGNTFVTGSKKSLTGGEPYVDETTDLKTGHAMSATKALLRTYEAYQKAIELYGKNHVYAIGRTDSEINTAFPWGDSFMKYLSSISGNDDDIDAIVTDGIYYLLSAGSRVEDYMGYVEGDYDFDFVNDAEALTLQVGKESYAAEEIAENVYGFCPSGNGYDYTVTYVRGNGQDEEHFVWNINVPVSNFEPVQLTYTVKLANPKTEAGTYGTYDADGSKGYEGLYTNKSATLHPVDSNKDGGTPEDFARPTVSYEVAEVVDPVVPATPEDPTVTPDEPAAAADEPATATIKPTPLAQTGDPLGVAASALVLAAVAGGSALALARRRNRQL